MNSEFTATGAGDDLVYAPGGIRILQEGVPRGASDESCGGRAKGFQTNDRRRKLLGFLNAALGLFFLIVFSPWPGGTSVPGMNGKLRVVELEGTPYEMGKTHGAALKPEITELIRRWKSDLAKTYKTSADEYIRKFLIHTDFRPSIEKWTPGLLDEVRGLADGAGVDFETMYAFQLIDESWVMSNHLVFDKCTSIAAGKRAGFPAFTSQTQDIQPAAPQNYLIGGLLKAAGFERSAGKMIPFLPFEGAEFVYHTNHPVVSDDLNPDFSSR
jgi:hypothetical protein